MGDLRLDTRLDATAWRAHAARAIDPGSPDTSLAILTIESGDDAVRMPPDRPLTTRQIELLRQWVTEGAPYAEHWAWQPPAPITVPPGDHPVDAFIDATLARTGFVASERATPETRLRRASLVVTGLPPTLEELDAFLADPSDAAYEAAVDRMLASDRHAEHLARDWLDHVGYGDSNGMYADTERDMSAWRDWVIAAFRDDMPLDQFVTRQLAGDLAGGADSDAQLATAMLRLHRTTEEGGIYLEEFRALYASERAELVANSLMGVTMQCARCHNHRYDPLSQRDYYRLTACFNRVNDEGGSPPLVPYDARPVLVAAGPLQREALAVARDAANLARTALAALDVDALVAAWEEELTARTFQPAMFGATTTTHGTSLAASAGTVTASGASPHIETWDVEVLATAPVALRLSDWMGRADTGVVLSEVRLRIESPSRRHSIPLDVRSAVDGSSHEALTDGTTAVGMEIMPGRVLLLIPRESVVLAPGEHLHLALDMQRGNASTTARLRVEASSQPSASLDDALDAILARDPASRSPSERASVRAHYLRFAASATVRAQAARLDALERRAAALSVAPHTRVMHDDDPARLTSVLARGDFFRPLEEVTCGAPAALAPDGVGDFADRGELARYLVSEGSPLTARVLANRLFQLVFGRGLVATPQDFGTRGALLSHPALLDWLAGDLMDSGWDARALIRLLVTSEAFQRSSVARPDLLEVDPHNELLAMGPRRRLDAEVIRDQALFVSGLLVERMGGPSVRPYHPEGLYEQLTDAGESYMRTYRPDVAPDRIHRRAMYTFWRRSNLLPSLSLLDAPGRTGPAARREATITPTQSLALSNDPLFVEAARHLAERAHRETGGDVDASIRWLFRACTARAPLPDEQVILRQRFDDEIALISTDATALVVLDIGESDRAFAGDPSTHAALTAVARTVLTLGETITEE